MRYTDDEWFKDRIHNSIEEDKLQESDRAKENKKKAKKNIIALSAAGILAFVILLRIVSQLFQVM